MTTTAASAAATRHRGAPARRLALAIVAVVALAACEQVEVRTYDETRPPNLALHYLTREGADQTATSVGPGWFRASAPTTNTGTNTRAVLYAAGTSPAVDQQACATWVDQTGVNTQQGIALRVRREADGRWRAVTVTKNVLFGAHWQFNVLTWDTRGGYGWRSHGAVSLPEVFFPDQRIAPLPWRVCARVRGDLVTVKAWPAGDEEPAWGDATHGGSVALPAGWAFEGKAGWYIGHLAPGTTAGFEDLTADNVVVRP